MRKTSRRKFLISSLAAGCAASGSGGAAAASLIPALRPTDSSAPPRDRGASSPAFAGNPTPRATPPGKKGLVYTMLPATLNHTERLKMARDTGFEVVQVLTISDEREAEQIKSAADSAGIRIDSVMNADHWKYPLSSGDPAVVEKCMAGMRTSLHNAKLWGSDAVLLVPAVVNPQTTYRDAWVRSQKQIRELIPLAEELKIVIAIEEVWNKFLLSPLEMSSYIAEFHSPWIRAWFDVGNVVLYGYPQDWIHTLGSNIIKVHLKDFKRTDASYAWVNLGGGDVDWPAVRRAFADVGYSGSFIAELEPGDEAYLRDVSRRIDRLLFTRP